MNDPKKSGRVGTTTATVRDSASTAPAEPAFFRWIAPDRTPSGKQAIVDAFYAGLETRIAADPVAATCHWRTVTLRLVRR